MATTMDERGASALDEIEVGESAVQAFGGLAVIVLAILGLSGLASALLSAIAGIVIGVALLAEGATVAGEFSVLVGDGGATTRGEAEVGSGMTIEFLAGGAITVLGILALIGDAPHILLAALIIVGGTALILTTGTMNRLDQFKMEHFGASGVAQRAARGAASGAAGAQLLAGLAAIVLGILALVSTSGGAAAAAGGGSAGHAAWLTLVEVSFLVLGTALALSRATLAGRLIRVFGRR